MCWWLWAPKYFHHFAHWNGRFGVDDSAPSSVSAAEDISALMFLAMFKTAPLFGGLVLWEDRE
jgi:hypothetical protein